jgi:hypothetical protein
MTTDKSLLAFQGFIARRGLPQTIYTDNAQTFHAANRELAELWGALSAYKTIPSWPNTSIGGNTSRPGRLGGKGW